MILSVDDLTLRRGERTLFEGFSLTAAAGEAVALVGRNGAGKTSLLRAVAGLLRPEAGDIRLDGAAERGDAVHLVGHHDGLRSTRTAAEELRFWSRWFGGTDASAETALRRMRLEPVERLAVRRLSAGQRRRLALARLLAAPRPLWLLDEPLAPLDADWRTALGEIMAEHLAGGGLILAAVHDPLPLPCRTVQVGG